MGALGSEPTSGAGRNRRRLTLAAAGIVLMVGLVGSIIAISSTGPANARQAGQLSARRCSRRGCTVTAALCNGHIHEHVKAAPPTPSTVIPDATATATTAATTARKTVDTPPFATHEPAESPNGTNGTPMNPAGPETPNADPDPS